MRKVFWDNPYQQKLTTHVSLTDGNQALFDETIAFSFAGGQESDRTFINDMPILDSKRIDDLIFYTLPEGHGLSRGMAIVMTVDWPRRYRLMRLHFATELILELVTQMVNWEKVGAHIAEGKARIDFKSEANANTLFESLLPAFNKIIDGNHPIEKGYLDTETQRRYRKIDGFAQVPCGGTHVRSTGEVGRILLKRDHPGKGIERIEIRLVDPSALEPGEPNSEPRPERA